MQADFAFDVGEKVRYILDSSTGTFVLATVTDRGYRKNSGRVYYMIRLDTNPRKRIVAGRSLQSI